MVIKAFHTYTALSNKALKEGDLALIDFKLGTSGSWLALYEENVGSGPRAH